MLLTPQNQQNFKNIKSMKTPILSMVGYVDQIETTQNHSNGKVYTSTRVTLYYDDRYEFQGQVKGKENRVEFEFSEYAWNQSSPFGLKAGDLVKIDFQLMRIEYVKNGETKFFSKIQGKSIAFYDQGLAMSTATNNTLPPVQKPTPVAGLFAKPIPTEDNSYLSDPDDLPF
jgi:hypothetical protein